MSSKLFSRVLGIGLVGLVVLSGSTAAWAGPVTTKMVISRKTLKPGVTLVHSRITVRGVFGAQEVYKLSWKFGNQHVSLHSSLLGAYDDSSTWITDHQISHLASAGGPSGHGRRDDRRLLDLPELEPHPEHDERAPRPGPADLPPRHGQPGGRLQAQRPVHHGPPDAPADEARASRAVRRRRSGRSTPAPPPSRRRSGATRSPPTRTAGDAVTIPANAVGVVLDSDVLATQLRGRRTTTRTCKGLKQVRDRRGVPDDRVDRRAAARLDAARNPLDLRDRTSASRPST